MAKKLTGVNSRLPASKADFGLTRMTLSGYFT